MSGRPTKLTPELRDSICELIAQGNFPETAAQACGIHRATYYQWAARGRDGEQPFRDFADAVARARADAQVTLLSELRAKALEPKGGSHIQWLLERLNRERFGPQVKIQVANELERYIDVAEQVLDSEQFARLLEAWASADDSPEALGSAQGEQRVH